MTSMRCLLGQRYPLVCYCCVYNLYSVFVLYICYLFASTWCKWIRLL